MTTKELTEEEYVTRGNNHYALGIKLLKLARGNTNGSATLSSEGLTLSLSLEGMVVNDRNLSSRTLLDKFIQDKAPPGGTHYSLEKGLVKKRIGGYEGIRVYAGDMTRGSSTIIHVIYWKRKKTK